jgi:hypothetical protein
MAQQELKTRPTGQSVEAFLDAVPDAARRADCAWLLAAMRRATGAEPRMWGPSIVGFGVYRYKYESGREGEWPVIGFSPRRQDLSVYIMPGFERFGALLDKLGRHRTGKSCLYLKRLADVDTAVLEQLIARSVSAMARQRIDDVAPGVR